MNQNIQSFQMPPEELPNPESHRQIANEIADLHLKPHLFPSFDRDDCSLSQFQTQQTQHQVSPHPLSSNLASVGEPPLHYRAASMPDGSMQGEPMANSASEPFIDTHPGTSQAKPEQRASKCSYINTNYQSSPAPRRDHSASTLKKEGLHEYFMSFNKDGATPAPTPPITTAQKYSSGPYVRTSQDDDPSMAGITYTTGTTHNANAYFLGITGNHAKLGRLLGDKATFRSKTQFKVLLDCFRGWQDYVGLHQRQKKLKRHLLSGLIRAINKHEEVLLLKTFQSMRLAKQIRLQNQSRTIQLRMLMHRNLLSAYFSRMRRVQREGVLEKGVSVVAKQHFRRRMKQKCLREWRAKARKTKEQLMKVISLMKKKPLVMITLMNFIGYQVMPREQQNKFDLLDFHSYCTLKNRFRPIRGQFAQNLGLALKAKLRQIVKAWKA